MDFVMWVAVLAIPASVGTAVWLFISGPSPVRAAVEANLARGRQQVTLPAASTTAPSTSAKASLLMRLTPAGWGEQIMAKLARAGVTDGKWTPERVLLGKFALAVFVALFLLVVLSGKGAVLLLVPVGAVAGWFVPELLIYNVSLKRREAIDLELPDILDQMSIAVSAGLGFDSAMMRVARSSKGALPKEMVRTLQDMQLGKTRRDAFVDLADRAGSGSLRKFTRAIISAGEYGIPVTAVLHQQADEMRDVRKQKAEKKAAGIPVLVTMPLMVFILPTLFIVMLGPAALQIIDAFSGL